jgi:hypothetical protein
MLSGSASSHGYRVDGKSRQSASIPLRLLDCFLLVTPAVSEAFLGAGHEADAVFLVGLMPIGADSGGFSTNEGDGTAIASAICRDWCERWFPGRARWQLVISYARRRWPAKQKRVESSGVLQISKRETLSKVEKKLGRCAATR